MNPDRWRQIEEVFHAAADHPASGRANYLAQVCGEDEELMKEVASLLAQDNADTFIHEPIKNAAASLTARSKEDLANQRIGAFRITHLVGRGGMGAVYGAVRDDGQFDQQVAIKVVKREMDTDVARDRFRRERQILAKLEHPHIARLLDGGTTEDGSPYFVMEYVAGQPITDYCRRHQLSLIGRLRLFLRVCSAVQYAHQKLIVHRDLKPSNILVVDDDAPKLLDFGIAKLMAQDSDEAATQTETLMRAMTPDYASPEQVRGLPVTTATDVYSLGVVLYELLTGCRPHQFKSRSFVEIEQAICDTETEAPSKVVRRAQDAPASLSRRLAGDLDNIVMMALRKEPERRYQSVEQFSEDIRRHLEGRPVIARKDTVSYRASKFARRHKLMMAAAALVALSLMGGIVATSWQARRAEHRFEQVRRLANTFLFDFHDGIRNLPGSTQAREMVARTAMEYLDSLAAEATGDEELEWELAVAYQKVGDVQGDPWAANLGHHQEAMKSYRKGLALAEKLSSSQRDDPKMLRLLAKGYFKVGALESEAGDKIAAGETLRRAVATAVDLQQQSGELDDLVLAQNCYVRLGDTQLDTGDPAGALESYDQSLRLSERRVAERMGEYARLSLSHDHSHVGEARAAMGDLSGAMASYRLSLSIVEELLQEDSSNQRYLRAQMIASIWLGHFEGNPRFINQGNEEAALQHYRKAMALAETLAARDAKDASARLDLAGGYKNIADVLSLSDPMQGVEYYRKALFIIRALLNASPDEFRYLRREACYLKGLAAVERRMGDRQGALQNLRESLRILRSLSGRAPVNTQVQTELHSALIQMADLSLEAGDLSAALEHCHQALALAEWAMTTHSSDAYALWRLADSYAGLGRYHARLGDDSKAATEERATNWRTAREWRSKSLDVWEKWAERAVSSVFNLARREEAARALAECDAALAGLRGR